MNKKLILFSIDGLRPDGAKSCGSGSLEKLMEMSTYTFSAKTVMPSITLPCHMSLFYGVEPTRHGILSNTFVPQVHTIKGIFEKTAALGKTNAIFYGWEPLRDVAPAGTCRYATYINCEGTLPVYSILQGILPYPVCLVIYFVCFTLIAYLILLAAIGIKKLAAKKEKKNG